MNKVRLLQAYKEFEHADGNQHIASEYAVLKLAEIIECFEVKKILEIGLGIGSISGTLLEVHNAKELQYSGTENNAFCLNALKGNLGSHFSKLKIYSNIEDISEENEFDLIIIDGKDENLKQVRKLLSANGIIAIEGDRLSQQEIMKELFPAHKYVHSISTKKNSINSPFASSHWQGGIKIIFGDPSRKQRLWWMREKLLTKLKYIYRNY